MIVRATEGLRRARSVRSVALISCAVLAIAGLMVVGARAAGPGPVGAQFGAGFGNDVKVRWHRRRRRGYYRGRRGPREDNDGPEPDVERGASPTNPADPDRPTVRPSSAPPDSRPASRPQRRGPDLNPEK
jgi:hypothetical protein